MVKFPKSGKLELPTDFLLMLIGALISLILSWINQQTYNSIESIISYKSLLIIWLMSIILKKYYHSYKNTLDLRSEQKKEKFPISELKKEIGEPGKQTQPMTQPQHELNPRDIHYRLSGLTKKEKEYLKKFFEEDVRILYFPPSDEVVEGLVSMGILQFVSTIAKPFGYSIYPIYWDYLKKRPDVIGL